MVGLIGTLTPEEQYGGGLLAPAQPTRIPGLLDAMREVMGPSVLSRMQQADAQQQARLAGGNYSPTPMTEENMWLADDVAGGLLGPVGFMGAIKAYHGSPHRFDRFDMSKIGTGEGGKMLGHGLHLSSKPSVARQYGRNVYTTKLDDSRILDMRKRIEDLPSGMRSRLENAGVINSPVQAETVGAITTFKVGDRPVRIVEETTPGRFSHFLGTGEPARPLPGQSVGEFAKAVAKEYPASGPLTQILEGGQVSERLADRLRAAGVGGIVDTDLSAKSAAGRRGGKPADVFLIFDDNLLEIEKIK